MRFTRADSLQFFFYTCFFFLIFSGYQIARGPYFETTFDSASIENQEVPVSLLDIAKQEPLLPKKTPKKSSLTIAFNPDYVKIDENILGRLREVIYSSHFLSKVTPLHLVLDTERLEPRGQVVGNKLILATSVPSDSERLKVFVHELGHIIDIFYLKKGLLSDPSDDFYTISWESFNTKKKGQKIANFVSGYALSNKYEDFAESFTFYVFHNEDFALRAKTDPILARKYDFFRSRVFQDDVFVGTSFGTELLKEYHWDITKVSVDTKKYFYYIQ